MIDRGKGMAKKVRMVFITDSCTTNPHAIEATPGMNNSSATRPSSGITETTERTQWIGNYTPPAFEPHRWLRGGHLQTLVSAAPGRVASSSSTSVQSQRHRVDLPDGDAVVLHDDAPVDWDAAQGSVLLVHGICGCHAAPYMIRFRRRLNVVGIRTFRLDMRGCGDSAEYCRSITHAGRSEDILSALEFIGGLIDDPTSPIGGVGVSLGGNQWLLAAARVGSGHHAPPDVWPQVGPILSIAPPIDLQACSDAMQSPKLRFYNRYFIHHLLARATPALLANPVYQNALAQPRPRTLRQFDRTFTAPLGGFDSERDYYRESSAIHIIDSIQKPTLIVTSRDDPLVPIGSFQPLHDPMDGSNRSDSPIRLHVTATGGHHGFLQADRTSWSDDLVTHFFSQGMNPCQ